MSKRKPGKSKVRLTLVRRADDQLWASLKKFGEPTKWTKLKPEEVDEYMKTTIAKV